MILDIEIEKFNENCEIANLRKILFGFDKMNEGN
jgi:hypothetical protein